MKKNKILLISSIILIVFSIVFFAFQFRSAFNLMSIGEFLIAPFISNDQSILIRILMLSRWIFMCCFISGVVGIVIYIKNKIFTLSVVLGILNILFGVSVLITNLAFFGFPINGDSIVFLIILALFLAASVLYLIGAIANRNTNIKELK